MEEGVCESRRIRSAVQPHFNVSDIIPGCGRLTHISPDRLKPRIESLELDVWLSSSAQSITRDPVSH